eukprot:scaffold4471_cov238-Prasinococcus_capsulatus_cf.AAC.3
MPPAGSAYDSHHRSPFLQGLGGSGGGGNAFVDSPAAHPAQVRAPSSPPLLRQHLPRAARARARGGQRAAAGDAPAAAGGGRWRRPRPRPSRACTARRCAARGRWPRIERAAASSPRTASRTTPSISTAAARGGRRRRPRSASPP